MSLTTCHNITPLKSAGIGRRLLKTSWAYGWESYHSSANDVTGLDYPTPYLCDHLGLMRGKRSADLFDHRQRVATKFKSSYTGKTRRFNFLYLRQDLLDRYLAETGQAVVWVIWGERGFGHPVAPGIYKKPDVSSVLQNHEHVHKELKRYDAGIGA